VAEYRVDELARAAGTSVRNVRVYQERGLLPPPRRVGRTGIYTDNHLARLRLIRLLLQRGYTFATIGELIEAWSSGQKISDLLGLDDALAVPWSDETPETTDSADLISTFGPFDEAEITRAVELGFIRIEGDEFVVVSPRLLEAGSQLVATGVPLAAVLELAANLQTHFEEIARQFFKIFDTHVAQEGRSTAEVAESLMRLRPFARQTGEAMLSMALARESEQLLARRAARSRKTRTDSAV
jgi:DNA-binding transcriptional MerR regulator